MPTFATHNSKIKVSVVIPVYNTAPYLEDCLQSVASQTLKDFEAICVDDASTDGSVAIADSFACKDRRFRLIIHSQNQGAGASRNTGLTLAQGTYVTFLDSDDTIDPHAFERIYNHCETTQADICCCPIALAWPSEDRVEPYALSLDERLLPDNTTEPFPCSAAKDGAFMFTQPSVCTKWFRRSFLDRIGAHFTNHRVAEDLLFTYTAFVQTERITILRDYLYAYNQEKDSSISKEPNSMASLVKTMDEFVDRLMRLEVYNTYEVATANLFLSHCSHALELADNPDSLHAAFDACRQWGRRLRSIDMRFLFPYYEIAYRNLCSGTPETYLFDMIRVHQEYARLCEARAKELDKVLMEQSVQLEELRRDRDEIENSRSFKLGRTILRGPSAVKTWLGKN